eukprot:gb/GEZN01000659.1/.p1 GENE.gb/GEZN01000659.1/~~gb/GEZN01000659.1/.p1  ORF type:complete len:824 (-),score=264.94 gb/GEZN01000659.1/:1436-3787(-)
MASSEDKRQEWVRCLNKQQALADWLIRRVTIEEVQRVATDKGEKKFLAYTSKWRRLWAVLQQGTRTLVLYDKEQQTQGGPAHQSHKELSIPLHADDNNIAQQHDKTPQTDSGDAGELALNATSSLPPSSAPPRVSEPLPPSASLLPPPSVSPSPDSVSSLTSPTAHKGLLRQSHTKEELRQLSAPAQIHMPSSNATNSNTMNSSSNSYSQAQYSNSSQTSSSSNVNKQGQHSGVSSASSSHLLAAPKFASKAMAKLGSKRNSGGQSMHMNGQTKWEGQKLHPSAFQTISFVNDQESDEDEPVNFRNASQASPLQPSTSVLTNHNNNNTNNNSSSNNNNNNLTTAADSSSARQQTEQQQQEQTASDDTTTNTTTTTTTTVAANPSSAFSPSAEDILNRGASIAATLGVKSSSTFNSSSSAASSSAPFPLASTPSIGKYKTMPGRLSQAQKQQQQKALEINQLEGQVLQEKEEMQKEKDRLRAMQQQHLVELEQERERTQVALLELEQERQRTLTAQAEAETANSMYLRAIKETEEQLQRKVQELNEYETKHQLVLLQLMTAKQAQNEAVESSARDKKILNAETERLRLENAKLRARNIKFDQLNAEYALRTARMGAQEVVTALSKQVSFYEEQLAFMDTTLFDSIQAANTTNLLMMGEIQSLEKQLQEQKQLVSETLEKYSSNTTQQSDTAKLQHDFKRAIQARMKLSEAVNMLEVKLMQTNLELLNTAEALQQSEFRVMELETQVNTGHNLPPKDSQRSSRSSSTASRSNTRSVLRTPRPTDR